jgi:dephospho-CoA kinase
MIPLIGVCGYSGAGKTTFCQVMSRRFPLPVLSTGEIVRRRVAERGYALTPENITRVSDEIRRETDQFFLRILAPDLKALSNSPAVLIDCLREDNDLLTLRELSDRATLVAVTAADEVRASRLLGRGRPGDPTSRDGLRDLDETEKRLGADRLIAAAGYILGNDGGLDRFIERSAAVVEEILSGRPRSPAGRFEAG